MKRRVVAAFEFQASAGDHAVYFEHMPAFLRRSVPRPAGFLRKPKQFGARKCLIELSKIIENHGGFRSLREFVTIAQIAQNSVAHPSLGNAPQLLLYRFQRPRQAANLFLILLIPGAPGKSK